MSFRSLSPQVMFEKMALEHVPQFRFKAKNTQEFARWKKAAYPRVMATLGDFPKRVPADPMLLLEYEHDELIKQRWLINVGPHIAAEFLINYPKDLKKGQKRPAILCCHGHGNYGKEPVMGNDSSAELRSAIAMHKYNYGHVMAKLGYITYAIDWIGFGERNDAHRPNFRNNAGGRDWCNIYYLHATMLGTTSLAINVTHGQAATDFALTLPHVDGNRLGVMGLSGGGTMALWMGLADKRFKATEVICYSDLFAYFGIRDTNYCGMQVAPGLFKLVDLPDLQGLMAPAPMLIDIGANDTCFRPDQSLVCYKQLEKIYKAASASENLWLDLHSGEHGWGANKSEAFFGKYLGMAE